MKSHRIYLSSVILLIFLVFFATTAQAQDHRHQLIDRTLDCYDDTLAADHLNYNDICYLDADQDRQKVVSEALDRADISRRTIKRSMAPSKNNTGSPSYIIPSHNYTVINPSPRFKPTAKSYEQTALKNEQITPKKKQTIFRNEDISTELVLGSEMYMYYYNEPTLDVTIDGEYYGIFSSYTFRTQQNKMIDSFKDVFTEDSHVNMFKVDGRMAWGWVDYDGSGTYEGLNDIVLEIRGLAGYDLPLSSNMLCTPYVGLGYRYLKNGLDEIPAQTIGGVDYYSGYERESKYYYIPIGFDLSRTYENNWSWNVNFEYDLFIQGDQDSHLEDMEDLNGNNPNFSTLENDQDKGFGIRGSFRIIKSNKNYDIFAEPYARYWKIDESNAAISCSGDTGTCLAGYEPKNETAEYGFSVGVNFN